MVACKTEIGAATDDSRRAIRVMKQTVGLGHVRWSLEPADPRPCQYGVDVANSTLGDGGLESAGPTHKPRPP